MSQLIYSSSYLAVSFLVLVLVVVTTKEEIYCIGSCSDPRNLQYEEICCNPKNFGEVLKIPGEGLRQKYIHCPSTLPSGCIQEKKSCREIFSLQSSPSSGYYSIQLDNGTVVSVYCDMEGTNCDSEGGWTGIVRLNMTEPNASCPAGIMKIDYDNIDHDLCGNREFSHFDCQSIFYGMGINYSKICGQVRGYILNRFPQGFYSVYGGNIDYPYVEGISITRGMPRQHIWTFAAGRSEDSTDYRDCPCNNGSSRNVPSFVGNDYYCESSRYKNVSDPLWDGKQCDGLEYPCCTNPQLPWFIKSLNQESDDDIELRLCTEEFYGQIHFDILELYVK